jgi:hypothetical protein
MQSNGYSHLDTILTLKNNSLLKNTAYIFKRIDPSKPYLFFGSDTIDLSQKLDLDRSDTIQYFIVYNSGRKPIKLQRQDGSMITVKEAINYQNKWLPVEFWNYSWCGNSYIDVLISPGQLLVLKTLKLKGEKKTTMRMRLKSETNGVLLSEPFETTLDPNYFVLNTSLKRYFLKVDKWFTYLK